MSLRVRFVIICIILAIMSTIYVFWYDFGMTSEENSVIYKNKDEKVTIRVNTFRRLDLLENFLDYYNKCSAVDQIQVVWSDTINAAPIDWETRYNPGKVIFEIHKNNSLTNRFKPIIPVPTEAVLSIDDDLIVPCRNIRDALNIWQSNRRALVGFTPRMHAYDIITGSSRYLRWQHSWWNGIYSIMLTKVAYMHRDYMQDYMNMIPKSMDDYIDQHRNCEDIAMAHVIASKTNAAPVWTRGTVFEVSVGGISSAADHFLDRGKCLEALRGFTNTSPWVTGYQKLVHLSMFDRIYTYDD